MLETGQWCDQTYMRLQKEVTRGTSSCEKKNVLTANTLMNIEHILNLCVNFYSDLATIHKVFLMLIQFDFDKLAPVSLTIKCNHTTLKHTVEIIYENSNCFLFVNDTLWTGLVPFWSNTSRGAVIANVTWWMIIMNRLYFLENKQVPFLNADVVYSFDIVCLVDRMELLIV